MSAHITLTLFDRNILASEVLTDTSRDTITSEMGGPDRKSEARG
jgi:hypothetical protein